jgi:hypothetical protein
MKKDAYYFSHDANAQDDPKCMVLIDQLGMEGYGIFWALIEKLRNESNYKLPLAIVGSLARRWGTSKEKVETVITKYDLFVLEGAHFFSLRLLRSMEEKSEKARISANSRWHPEAQPPSKPTNYNAHDAIGMQSHTDAMQNDAIKVKERKVKESKILAQFEIFWELYGKKVDRKRALTSWRSLTDEERQLSIEKAPSYVSATPIVQYRKNPTTYLNGKCWQDELNAIMSIPLSVKKMVD